MKKAVFTKAILLSLSIALSACGAWDQNPLKGAQSKMGDGQETPTIPQKPETMDSEFLRVDAPKFKGFKEGILGEIEISARALEPNYSVSLSVDNLSEFTGATFDAASGKFLWTPPAGSITSGLAKEMTLKLVAFASLASKPTLRRTHEITIAVTKDPSIPTLTSVYSASSSVREGSYAYVTVEVEDKDGGTAAPTLLISNHSNYPSLAQFVTVPSPSVNGTKYVYQLMIDLRNVEVTKSYGAFGFRITPVSNFGKAGSSSDFSIYVGTSFSDPVSTWAQTLSFTAGEKIDHQFLVMDPKTETKLSLNYFSSLPTDAKVNCSSVSTSVLSCRLVWDTPVVGYYSASGYFNMRSQSYSDSYTKSPTLYFNFDVTTRGGQK